MLFRHAFQVMLLCWACWLFSACTDSAERVAAPMRETDLSLIQRCLEEQVAIGPRFFGSEAAEKTAKWIAEQSRLVTENECTAYIDEFTDATPMGAVTFRNVIATIRGKRPQTILLCAHYDTKQMFSIQNFVGANDGASGVAALLAMLHSLRGTTPEYTLEFCFFDGEESLYEYTDDDGLHGSRHHAAKTDPEKCIAVILLDMVGDRDLKILFPKDTEQGLLQTATETARKLGKGDVFSPGGPVMLDDHVPFAKRGIPAIDLIDFEYGPHNIYWHTAYDTLEHTSAESVKTVADFTLQLILDIAAKEAK